MRKDDFGLLRVGEFYEAVHAFREKENGDRRHIGELVRGATYLLFNLQVKKRIKDPSALWPMPWDEAPRSAEAEIEELTDEEKQASIDKLKGLMGI